MMASSITMPTASVSASSVMLFSEKSIPRISVKVAMMEVGMATAAISTARQLRMKIHTISAGENAAQNQVLDAANGRRP